MARLEEALSLTESFQLVRPISRNAGNTAVRNFSSNIGTGGRFVGPADRKNSPSPDCIPSRKLSFILYIFATRYLRKRRAKSIIISSEYYDIVATHLHSARTTDPLLCLELVRVNKISTPGRFSLATLHAQISRRTL